MDPVDDIIVANSSSHASHLLVIDAPQLMASAQQVAERVSGWCDDVRDAELLAPEMLISHWEDGDLHDVDLVWLRLPHSLDALDEYAEVIVQYCGPEVRIIAGGREKHLARSMNTTLAKHFSEVSASLGKRKARALMASGPIPSTSTWPRHTTVDAAGLELDLWWHGANFAAGRVDLGTQLLIDHIQQAADADSYLDLGSGTGLLAALLADLHPNSKVSAVDVSWAAVQSTKLTAGPTVTTSWTSSLAGFDAQSLDIIVCNPPFHRGAAKDSEPAEAMFTDAGRALVEGGEFWCVFNSHLPWKARLSQSIGSTTLIAQTPRYMLTSSRR